MSFGSITLQGCERDVKYRKDVRTLSRYTTTWRRRGNDQRMIQRFYDLFLPKILSTCCVRPRRPLRTARREDQSTTACGLGLLPPGVSGTLAMPLRSTVCTALTQCFLAGPDPRASPTTLSGTRVLAMLAHVPLVPLGTLRGRSRTAQPHRFGDELDSNRNVL